MSIEEVKLGSALGYGLPYIVLFDKPRRFEEKLYDYI